MGGWGGGGGGVSLLEILNYLTRTLVSLIPVQLRSYSTFELRNILILRKKLFTEIEKLKSRNKYDTLI